jgi:hypothetical protein
MRGSPRWPTLFSKTCIGPCGPWTRSHAAQRKSVRGKWDFTMRRIHRVEKLEHRVERIFLGISIALLTLVLLGIWLVTRSGI